MKQQQKTTGQPWETETVMFKILKIWIMSLIRKLNLPLKLERESERERMEYIRDQIQREHDLREQAAIMQSEQNQMFMTMMIA